MTKVAKRQEQQPAVINEAGKYLQAMGLANKMNDAETNQFLEICKAYQLNPFKREIYATKYGENFNIIVGFETYLKRAERSGKLAGWNITTQGSVKDNSLKAIITIYRKGWEHPFVHEVYYYEYVQRTKAGDINKFWREKPVTMTKKVAMSQGFRLCFSDDLGGMPYTSEEIVTENAMYEELESRTRETNDLQEALQSIEDCMDLDELKFMWEKYKHLQKQVDFLAAKEAKKELLTNKNKEEK